MSFSEIRDKLLHFLRPPRRLSFTPEGARFVLVALAIGVAAINTGNNLLYLVLAMMLSMIILSGILSESSLRMVNVKRYLPKEAFAGRPFLVKVTALNNKRRFPSISLVFRDNIDRFGPAGSQYFLKIPPNGSVSGNYYMTLDRRGIYIFQNGRLSTRYPFGLFLKSKDVGEEAEILVYPRMLDVNELLMESGVNEGEIESKVRGRGTDLYGLRGYVLGDDRRAIHWKTSAKLSKLYIKEFAREDVRKVVLFLDNCIPPGLEESLEKGITITASLASRFLYKGYQVGLVTSVEEIPLGIGMEHLFKILKVLALTLPGKDRDRLITRTVDSGGVLILPYDSLAWRDKENSFAKIIRIGL